jgi:hypothetical protein
MPNVALTQFLARIVELKRKLMAYEDDCRTDDRSGASETANIRMQALKREIVEYERAITALMPRRASGLVGPA